MLERAFPITSSTLTHDLEHTADLREYVSFLSTQASQQTHSPEVLQWHSCIQSACIVRDREKWWDHHHGDLVLLRKTLSTMNTRAELRIENWAILKTNTGFSINHPSCVKLGEPYFLVHNTFPSLVHSWWFLSFVDVNSFETSLNTQEQSIQTRTRMWGPLPLLCGSDSQN